jgi:hypothetical protein
LIGLIFLFFGFHHTCHAKSPNSSNERKRKKKRFWGNFLQKAKNISRQNAKRKKKRRRERGLDAVEGAESSSSLSDLLLFSLSLSFFSGCWLLLIVIIMIVKAI